MRSNNPAEAVFRVFVVALLVLGGIIGAVLALQVWIERTVRGNQDRVKQLMRAFRRGRVTKWYADATRNSAGKTHSPYALLSHVGRRSGQPYQTVTGASAYGDGYILPLVYGRQCDWCRNALAAGKATLAWRGHTYELDQPEIISAAPEVVRAWPAWERIVLRQVREYLWLHQKKKHALGT
jgi:deazaflavin-dependent oxidoreductase (nitroreductase family)